jgi:hypothetical protein
MGTCPECGASSRVDPTFEISKVLITRHIGDFSLAGAQIKLIGQEVLVLRHLSCGWYIYGYIKGNDFVSY